MATVFVVANQTGGIGKSTTATNLAGILGKKAKTLLIDADPQGNSTSTYEAKVEDVATLYDVMIDSERLPITEAIQHTENGDIVGMNKLAECYLAGVGTEADPARAFFWAEKMAEAGSAGTAGGVGCNSPPFF